MEAHNRMLSLFNEACNAVSNDDVHVFVHRALFLGLSSNPHITDLHLDISSCEVPHPPHCSPKPGLSSINACPLCWLQIIQSVVTLLCVGY